MLDCPASLSSEGTGDHWCGCEDLLAAYVRYARRVRALTDETLDDYRRCLVLFLRSVGTDGRVPCRGLRPETVERFAVEYDRDRGPGARHWMHVALRSFLTFCRWDGHTCADLAAAVPPLRRQRLAGLPKAMATDDMLELARSLDRRGRQGLRDAAIVCLLATYGVRGTQLRHLRLEHIDWRASRIRFPAAKGGVALDQPLTPEAGNRLLYYMQEARPPSSCPEVFLTALPPYGRLRASSSLSAMICRRLRQARIRLPAGVSHGTHSFRHAFACRLVGRVPLRTMSEMLGHRDPASTMVYAKVDFLALQQAALPWPGRCR